MKLGSLRIPLLAGLLALVPSVWSQTTLYWRAEAANGNWSDASNWWNGSTTETPGGSEILRFANDVQPTMTNDLAATTRFGIYFDSGCTVSRTIGGSTTNAFASVASISPVVQNDSTATHTLSFPISLGTDGLYVNANTAALTLGGTISGTGFLTKQGSNTLTLSGSNSYSGATSINNGVLQVSAENNLGATPGSYTANQLVLNGGTLKATAGFSVSNNRGLTLSGTGGTLDDSGVGNGSNFNINSKITGTGNLTLKANGDTSDGGGGVGGNLGLINTTNDFVGTVTINSGVVNFASDACFGNTSNVITITGGGLVATDNRTLPATRSIVLSGGGDKIFRVYGSRTFTINGGISGTGNIRHTDGGTLALAGGCSNTGNVISAGGSGRIVALAGTNTYTGYTWATNTSTIRLDANDTLPDGTTVLLYGGTTFNANGKTDTLGTLTTGSSGDTTVTVNLGSGANLTITNNSLPAGMTSGYGNGTIHGKITGTGNITYAHATAIAASAQWDWFNATNDFTGTVTVTQGRLRVASDAVLGNAANDLVFNGTPVATLGNQEGKASFQIASAGNLTLGAGRDIILNTGKEGTMYAWGSYTMTVNGKITGGGNLRKEDGGALLLANTANDYTGLTRIALGTLRVGAAGVIPDASGVEIAGGNLDLVGLTESVASLFGSGGAVNGGGTLTVLTSGSSTYNGVVQGGSTLSMAGGGTQTIAGTVDNDNGWAAVSSGTLVLGKTSGSSVHSVGRTDAVGLWITGGTAQLGGTGNDQIYFRTEVSQSAGVFDLNGRNEGIRGLTGSGGTVNNGAAATTSTLTVGESTSASNTFTYSGAIEDGAGQVALTKSGDGTQVLDGTSNYTGSTTVNGGTLRVQGTLGATATTVSATLPATARISGNGSLGGSLTLGVGGGFGVRIADWTGAPGTGFEDLAVASLAIASGAHTITVDASGLANFSETTKAFPFLLTLSGISGFNPADFTISAPGFTGTGTWTVQTNGNNLELVYTVLSNAYDDWATAKGLDGSNNGKGQDPDGDGRTNLQEFAFDGDPLSAVNDGKTVVKMVDLDGAGPEGQALVLVLPVRDSAVFSGPGDLVSAALDGVIYKIQGSDDLLDFTSMDVTEASDQSAGMPALSSGWTYRTFRTPGSVSDPDPGDFLRAMVQEGP